LQEPQDRLFPDDLVGQVAPSQAQLAALRAQYTRLTREIEARRDRVETRAGESAGLGDLTNQLRSAGDDKRALRESALADLARNDRYAALTLLRDRLSNQARLEHRSPSPDPARILALSEQSLSYAMEARELEQAALTDAQDYREAVDRQQSALERLRTAQAQVEAAVDADEVLAALEESRSALRPQLAAAEAYARASAQAADVAVDFARERIRLQYGGFDFDRRFDRRYAPVGYGFPFFTRSLPLTPAIPGGIFVGGGIVGGDPMLGGATISNVGRPGVISNVAR
jgi:crotonobetainyl-CoA:carnitine CoA-transferase CaiB-like acyl-CoA transferase